MDAREDARRDAREDAPRSATSFLSSSPVRSGNGHARGRTSRRRRRATRPRLARARRARARGWRAPHFARRGGRATPARRRTIGERGTTRPSLSEVPREREAPGVLNRGNGKPSRAFRRRNRRNGETEKKRVTNSYAQTVTRLGAVRQGGTRLNWRQTQSAFSRFAPRGAKELSGTPRRSLLNCPRALHPVGGVANTRIQIARESFDFAAPALASVSRAAPASSRRAAHSSRRASLFDRDCHRDVREPRFNGSRRAGVLRRRRKGACRAQGRLQ